MSGAFRLLSEPPPRDGDSGREPDEWPTIPAASAYMSAARGGVANRFETVQSQMFYKKAFFNQPDDTIWIATQMHRRCIVNATIVTYVEYDPIYAH